MKEKSLLRQWIEIQHERAMTRKALRLLTKQNWSVDFLTAMLIRASRVSNKELEMVIANGNNSIKIRTIDNPATSYSDDSIFDHLDDEFMVRNFINSINRR